MLECPAEGERSLPQADLPREAAGASGLDLHAHVLAERQQELLDPLHVRLQILHVRLQIVNSSFGPADDFLDPLQPQFVVGELLASFVLGRESHIGILARPPRRTLRVV